MIAYFSVLEGGVYFRHGKDRRGQSCSGSRGLATGLMEPAESRLTQANAAADTARRQADKKRKETHPCAQRRSHRGTLTILKRTGTWSCPRHPLFRRTRRRCSPSPAWCRSFPTCLARRRRRASAWRATRNACAPSTSTKWARRRAMARSSRCWATSRSATTSRKRPSITRGSC